MCRWLLRIFAGLVLVALALWGVGTFGLFGQPRDPLAVVGLVLLGAPWVQIAGRLPVLAGPWLPAAGALLNLAILALLCRLRRPR